MSEGASQPGAEDSSHAAPGATSPTLSPHAVGTVIGIIGPTGVGKTPVAVALALRLGVRVISCDSMQVYRGFRVLTNQPTSTDTDAVAHELVGCVDPVYVFSAAEYVDVAAPLVEADVSAHGWALVAGGTGLYLRALLAPLDMAPKVDPSIRHRFERRVASEGLGSLYDELRLRDPAAAEAIDPLNARRVMRALEVIEATGSSWSGRHDLWHPVYYRPTLIVALTLDRGELYRRIDSRAREIVSKGGIEEVRRFAQSRTSLLEDEGRDRAFSDKSAGADASGYGAAGILGAIGFREIYRYLLGEQTEEETIHQVAAATRRYARRQCTWLRKLGDAVIIDVRDRGAEEVAEEIHALALSGEHTKGHQRP